MGDGGRGVAGAGNQARLGTVKTCHLSSPAHISFLQATLSALPPWKGLPLLLTSLSTLALFPIRHLRCPAQDGSLALCQGLPLQLEREDSRPLVYSLVIFLEVSNTTPCTKCRIPEFCIGRKLANCPDLPSSKDMSPCPLCLVATSTLFGHLQ